MAAMQQHPCMHHKMAREDGGDGGSFQFNQKQEKAFNQGGSRPNNAAQWLFLAI